MEVIKKKQFDFQKKGLGIFYCVLSFSFFLFFLPCFFLFLNGKERKCQLEIKLEFSPEHEVAIF